MRIKKYDNGLVELIAAKGKQITQVSVEKDDDRIFGKLICLSKNETPDNYTEWTDAEVEEFEEKRRPKPEEEETPDKMDE